jgi:hypothetical protein
MLLVKIILQSYSADFKEKEWNDSAKIAFAVFSRGKGAFPRRWNPVNPNLTPIGG